MGIIPFLYYTAVLIYIALIIALLARKNRSALKNFTILILLSFALWGVGNIFLHMPGTDREKAFFWLHFTVYGGFFSLPLYVLSAAAFAKQKQLMKAWWFNLLVFGPGLYFYISQVSGGFVTEMQQHAFGWRPLMPENTITTSYYVYFLISCLLTVFFLVRRRLTADTPVVRKQAGILSVTFLFLFPVWMLNPVFFHLNIPAPELAVFSGLLWCAGLAYTVKKHDLLPMTPAATAVKIMSVMQDGVILTGRDGEVGDVNSSLRQIVSLEGADLRGIKLEDIFDVRLSGMLRLPADISGVTAVLKSNGRAVSVSSFSVRNRMDEFSGNVILVRDVGYAKKMEGIISRQAPLVRMGQLAAGVAHELNNPLAAIKNCIELLKRDDAVSGEKISRRLGIMDDSVERMSLIIKDLLIFSGTRPVNKQKIDINSLINNAVLLCRFQMKDLNVTTELGDIPEVMASRDQMLQVLINLISNAGDAVREKGRNSGAIRVRSGRVGGFIEISIWDSGSGIEIEALENIYNPFFTTKKEGTGLGLSIVKTIVEAHGGSISVESRKGQYTEFSVRLPAAGLP